jgi:hypothetical protein
VWAALPWLPCCHELAAQYAAIAHATHHAMSDATAGDEAAPSHCADTEPPDSAPCTDVQKNASEARLAHLDSGLAVVAYVRPLPHAIGLVHAPVPDPPRAIKRRPLHLEKSVLLI